MISRVAGSWLTALLALTPLPLLAQALMPGERIRLTVSTVLPRFEATLLGYDNDSLRFTPTDTAVVRAHAVAAIHIRVRERYRGRPRATGRGALIGTALGAAIGALLVVADPGECEPVSSCAVIGAGMVGAAGLVVGTVVGVAVGRPRWERLSLPLRP